MSRFPHLRGDGPQPMKYANDLHMISPPAWGWPVCGVEIVGDHNDFPTCVGMARSCALPVSAPNGFPHLRGDGPLSFTVPHRYAPISPPAWGWPDMDIDAVSKDEDFPTCVGMARSGRATPYTTLRFPHLRGDGPDQ